MRIKNKHGLLNAKKFQPLDCGPDKARSQTDAHELRVSGPSEWAEWMD